MGISNSKNDSTSTSSTSTSGPVQEVLAFCAKNHSDLPNVIDVLNNAAGLVKYKVHLVDHEAIAKEGFTIANPKLAVVIALCGTDRVDVVDKEMVDTLRTKGFKNVLLIILRRGNNPAAFRGNSDSTINSGVGKDKVLIQLVHFKGEVLMDADNNKENLKQFVAVAKLALN